MKSTLLVVLLTLSGWGSLTQVRDRNETVTAAAAAYSKGDFTTAASLYRRAVTTLGASDDAVLMNLAHACIRAGQKAEARTYYGRLLTSTHPVRQSTARQQLAVLAAEKGEYAQAVGLLRQALRVYPGNKAARYNYELLSRYLARNPRNPDIPPPPNPGPVAAPKPKSGTEPQQEPSAQPQPRPGDGHRGEVNDPDQPEDPSQRAQRKASPRGLADPNQPLPNPGAGSANSLRPGPGSEQRVNRGAVPGSTQGLQDTDAQGSRSGGSVAPATDEDTRLRTQRNRLEQMNLSSGQAKQILEALKAAEQQYLQQVPRRSGRKPDASKPNW
ncbi:tetratricopeptide repeat protein [Hymenobacter sp. BT175]|uniref:tetratricopeptide repeat protein n=1 Tax=Hymenobacter translucens TaxID=2886507 RepID=UPI001D0E0BA1|nr:tetratricopeptide repeat protein [Hymenobacter translucens]MCC2545195.1 tetratricopeptide repeat protein [Hymenobacter translucens]